MITGKELEEIANNNVEWKEYSNKIGAYKVINWQAIANELNQRTCETCANKKQCFQYVMIQEKTSDGLLADIENKITFCSLYTKEG